VKLALNKRILEPPKKKKKKRSTINSRGFDPTLKTTADKTTVGSTGSLVSTVTALIGRWSLLP